jgi:predicted transcriptional regulator
MKRGRLDIIKDILIVVQKNYNSIKITPLLRKSNLSSKIFKKYYNELIKKGFLRENENNHEKTVSLTDKGFKFLDRYKVILDFIQEFEL